MGLVEAATANSSTETRYRYTQRIPTPCLRYAAPFYAMRMLVCVPLEKCRLPVTNVSTATDPERLP